MTGLVSYYERRMNEEEIIIHLFEILCLRIPADSLGLRLRLHLRLDRSTPSLPLLVIYEVLGPLPKGGVLGSGKWCPLLAMIRKGRGPKRKRNKEFSAVACASVNI